MAVRADTRRWLIVAALFVVTYGVSVPLAAYGVFLPVIAEHFGWTRGAVSAALSLNLLVGGIAGFAVGTLADRHGPRVLLAATMALAGTGFALVAAVSTLWQLYLLVGLVAGVGTSSFYVLGTATVTHWFEDRRGLALALVLIGFNLGYITGGPAAAWLITRLGWRVAYCMLGSGCGLVTTIAALGVRLPRQAERAALRRPRPAVAAGAARGGAHGITLLESLTDPRQWALNVSWLLIGGIAIMISVHAVPFARDQGVSLTGASLALTAYGIGSAIGRLLGGTLSDRVGARRTIAAAFVLQIAALVGLLWVPSRAGLLLSLMAFGAGFAASDTVVAQVVPQVFGMRALGAIMGILTLGWRCGAAIGPALAGFLYDLTGSYRIPFGLAPLGVLLSWALFLLATARNGRTRTRAAAT
ncbi:MAG TPA: MFS transporter [Candidatus Dormibacteraeota bacterium]|nr:MFS transporter [Candidatus Dormibacteraeota bacterium]